MIWPKFSALIWVCAVCTKKTKASDANQVVASQTSLTFGPKYPPGPDDSKWSTVPHVKTLNKLTDQAAHAFIAAPGLDMENFKKMRQLNFDNWTDFRQNMAIPEHVVRGVQAILKNSKDEIEKFWLKEALDQIAAYEPPHPCL